MREITASAPATAGDRVARCKAAAPLLVGAGFKHAHLASIEAEGLPGGCFEVHAENYMGAGGPPHRMLAAIRRDYPLSVHGVCMSIGSPAPLDRDHLQRFAALVRRLEPLLVSEHLAWSSHGGTFYNDLLPLPYTSATLRAVCLHVQQVQEAIGRRLLLENPSTYVGFASSEMTEPQFLREVVRRTGCGLLLDLNNVHVSAVNHGFDEAHYLAGLPLDQVGEIHLAGSSAQKDDEGRGFLIDSHDRPVDDDVWKLYSDVISMTGPIPTIVEWDSALPEWPVLKEEVSRARRVAAAACQAERAALA